MIETQWDQSLHYARDTRTLEELSGLWVVIGKSKYDSMEDCLADTQQQLIHSSIASNL